MPVKRHVDRRQKKVLVLPDYPQSGGKKVPVLPDYPQSGGKKVLVLPG